MKFSFAFIVAATLFQGVVPCTQRYFGNSTFVCVCNATQCDYLPGEEQTVQAGEFRVTKSSIDLYRLDEEVLSLEDNNVVEADIDIVLDTTVGFQTMVGFGGTFTDSAAINILGLSQETQDNLLRAYFGPRGSSYNLCRIPMAGNDYSVRPYSYDDVPGDTELVAWSLADEDYDYKLPLIHRAMELSFDDLYLFGSPWSPPAWMKTNGMFNESGELLPEMWQPWSDYFVKFVEAYEAELGIPLWGLTTQNEPPTGFEPNMPFNGCGWTSEDMRDWIKANLGPTLESAGMRRLQLMVHDFNRENLPEYPEPMTSDPESSQYIDGIAVHWYSDPWDDVEVLDQTHDQSPDKFLLYTEASAGYMAGNILLGSWERGEYYIQDIIEACNHWSTGWVDFNLALDSLGGPSWAESKLDAAIIVNTDEDEFYVQPTHTALAMVSRNVKRGAQKISITNSDTSGNLVATAFLNPDSSVAVVLANLDTAPAFFGITDENGQVLTREIAGKTWETIVYRRN